MLQVTGRGSIAQRVVAFLIFVVCVVYLHTASGFTFGTWSSPKAGFVPTLAGVGGLILSAVNLLRTFRAGERRADFGPAPGKAALFLVGLTGYVLLLGWIGFLGATFVALLYLLKISDLRGWLKPLALSASVSVGAYLLFNNLLQLTLP